MVEDTWGTAMAMGYLQNALNRQDVFARPPRIAASIRPSTWRSTCWSSMTKYEPRMGRCPSSRRAGTSDEISMGRENVLSLLQAHPEPDSLPGFVSWWWPLTLGAGQAMKQMNRKNITLFNHYFSNQFLDRGQQPGPMLFSTDVPWHIWATRPANSRFRLVAARTCQPRLSRAWSPNSRSGREGAGRSRRWTSRRSRCSSNMAADKCNAAVGASAPTVCLPGFEGSIGVRIAAPLIDGQSVSEMERDGMSEAIVSPSAAKTAAAAGSGEARKSSDCSGDGER